MNDFTDRVEHDERCFRGSQVIVCVSECPLNAADLPLPDLAIAAQRDRLKRALSRLLRAFPRLASEFSTHEQQCAYRVALCALEETP